MVNTCWSGGAIGADTLWGKEALKRGHRVVHLSFDGHKHNDSVKKHIRVVSSKDLIVADPTLDLINRNVLKRTFPTTSEHTNNLLRRNYYQALKSQSIYAISVLDGNTVKGGTAWAVEIFKILSPFSEEIYVFDPVLENWFQWNFVGWKIIDRPPPPSGDWAGIGSRTPGLRAIEEIEKIFQDGKVIDT